MSRSESAERIPLIVNKVNQILLLVANLLVNPDNAYIPLRG